MLAAIPIQAIYTSPLERAVETAEKIAIAHRLQPIQCEALGEMKFGEWEGKPFSELVRPPNGELMIEVQARMVEAVEGIWQEHQDAVIVIVSHADPLRSLIAHLTGVALDHFQRIRLDPGSVSIVRFSGDWVEVGGLNWIGESVEMSLDAAETSVCATTRKREESDD
jgi:probable phosphoglycerate mutase